MFLKPSHTESVGAPRGSSSSGQRLYKSEHRPWYSAALDTGCRQVALESPVVPDLIVDEVAGPLRGIELRAFEVDPQRGALRSLRRRGGLA